MFKLQFKSVYITIVLLEMKEKNVNIISTHIWTIPIRILVNTLDLYNGECTYNEDFTYFEV